MASHEPCRQCGKVWGGEACHCTVCCRTFSTENNFDRHRRGEFWPVNERHCKDPAEIGLVLLASRAYECWGQPGGNKDWVAARAGAQESESSGSGGQSAG